MFFCMAESEVAQAEGELIYHADREKSAAPTPTALI